MRFKWLADEGGYTLLEALTGLVILVLVIGATGNMMIQAYRTKTAYNEANTKQADSVPGMDWIVRDIRRSTTVPVISGGGTILTLTIGGQSIQYTRSGTDVIRTGMTAPVAQSVNALSFTSDLGGTVHVHMQVNLSSGMNYQFDSYAIPRVGLKPGS